jgi:hypothetical protein
MKDLFGDVLRIDDVKGIMVFSPEGQLVFKQFLYPLSQEPETRDWWGLLTHSLKAVREVELVFERARIYVRKTGIGYLFVLTGASAPIAMVRLHCDILLPKLKETKTRKGLKGLLRKR